MPAAVANSYSPVSFATTPWPFMVPRCHKCGEALAGGEHKALMVGLPLVVSADESPISSKAIQDVLHCRDRMTDRDCLWYIGLWSHNTISETHPFSARTQTIGDEYIGRYFLSDEVLFRYCLTSVYRLEVLTMGPNFPQFPLSLLIWFTLVLAVESGLSCVVDGTSWKVIFKISNHPSGSIQDNVVMCRIPPYWY